MSLVVTIERNSDARGLAIIVTNDYKDSPKVNELSPLPGTIKDEENMKRAFEKLHFSVHCEKNISIKRFDELIIEAKHFSKYTQLKNYICIAFVFSGHGKSGDDIYMQDGNLVCIGTKIIESFLPENCPNMGSLPKLFFFDACRGDKDMQLTLVSKGHGARNADEFGDLTMKKIPRGSGFLVAYSTLPDYQAWEDKEEGGVWLTKLAKKITTSTSSIDDVLTEVNEELLQHENKTTIQQPEKLSRLNEKVFLYKPLADGPERSGAKMTTLADLTKYYKLTNKQLDCIIEDYDMRSLGNLFGPWMFYASVPGLGLNDGEKHTINVNLELTTNTMKMEAALKVWKGHVILKATFQNLLDIVLKLKEGNVGMKICGYIRERVV